jgi:hypothetical protein
MVNPVRRRQASRTMLETLAMAGAYALEESVMLGFVNDLIKPPLNFAEQGVVLCSLRDSQYIRQVPDSLDKNLKQWVITELGRNFLASL